MTVLICYKVLLAFVSLLCSNYIENRSFHFQEIYLAYLEEKWKHKNCENSINTTAETAKIAEEIGDDPEFLGGKMLQIDTDVLLPFRHTHFM